MNTFLRLSDAIPLDFTGAALAGSVQVWHRDGAPVWVGSNASLFNAIEGLGVTIPAHSGPHLTFTDAPALEHLFHNLPWLDSKVIAHTARAQAARDVGSIREQIDGETAWRLDTSQRPISWLLAVADPAHEVVLERSEPASRTLIDAQALDILVACGDWAVPAWIKSELDLDWDTVVSRLIELRDRGLIGAKGPLDDLLTEPTAQSTTATVQPVQTQPVQTQPSPMPVADRVVADAAQAPPAQSRPVAPTPVSAPDVMPVLPPTEQPVPDAHVAVGAAEQAPPADPPAQAALPQQTQPAPTVHDQPGALPTRATTPDAQAVPSTTVDPPAIERSPGDGGATGHGTTLQSRLSRLERREALLRRAQAAQSTPTRADALLRLVQGLREHTDA